MSDPRLLRVLEAVGAAYPGLRWEVRPHRDEDDGTEGWLVTLLDAPDGRLAEIEDFAWSRAEAEFGGPPTAVLLTALGKTGSAQYRELAPSAGRPGSASVRPPQRRLRGRAPAQRPRRVRR